MKRLPAFSAALFVIAALPLAAANVTGKITFVTKRGQNPVPAETLVWVEPVSGRAPRVAPATFQITTRNKTLVPHVLAIPVGSTVDFTNLDPFRHHVYSFSPTKKFVRHGGKMQKEQEAAAKQSEIAAAQAAKGAADAAKGAAKK